MYIDISKPPAPLPVLSPTQVQPGVTILPPLSRRGVGPGLVLLTANSEDHLSIRDGVPSALRKWAEEGYAVVEVQAEALESGTDVLSKAVAALSQCEKCEPKGDIGLIAYGAEFWNAVAPQMASLRDFAAVVVYADISERSSLATTELPLTSHLAGKIEGTPVRAPQLMEYEYPQLKTKSFATPFHVDFHYSSEAVSHTRNLTFLKKHMTGPIFDLEAIWDEHTYFEFENRSVEHTMATMVDEPYVNHIPTMTGGIGRGPLTKFYSENFVFQNPEDTELELISRTIGVDRVVDEFIFKFTHLKEVDWLIPGIPPTGKRLEIPFTAIVNIRGDRLYHEHIAWDQGTVLAQLDLLPQYLPFPYALPGGKQPSKGKKFECRVPVAGIATADKMRDKNSVASNEMFSFGIREVEDTTVAKDGNAD